MTIEEYKEEHILDKDYIVGPNEYVVWDQTIDDGETAWPLIYNQEGVWIDYFTVPIPALQETINNVVLNKYENIIT